MRSLVFVGGIVAALAASASGTTYVVYPDSIVHIGDFPNIRAAVMHVVAGDIIELGDGVFRGEGNRDVDYLGKEITIRSQNGDPRTCIIDCEASPTELHRGFLFTGVGPGGVLDGVTITNGMRDGGAIVLQESSPTISHCIFSHNVGNNGGAIYCDFGAAPTIAECVFVENTAWHIGGGICI
jgi:hypothetical protein